MLPIFPQIRSGAYAMSLAEHHRARLVLVHIRSENDASLSRAALDNRLQKLTRRGSNLNTEVLIAEGRPATKILEVAREHSADLIAMGVRGTGGSPRIASHFGSTLHDIIIGASRPVLTVRRARKSRTSR